MTTRPPATLGRRVLPAVLMTTAAAGLVALLDQPSSGAAIDLADSSTVAADQAGGAVATEPPVVSSTVPAVVEQPQQSPTVAPLVPANNPQPAATTQPPATQAPTTTKPAAASGVCEGKTLDGQTIDTRWGPVQVEAIVSATGQICDVDAIQSPDSHGRSVQINRQALPILHTQVMKAQSANINGVSGATVTSRGYVRSLQSILDGLG